MRDLSSTRWISLKLTFEIIGMPHDASIKDVARTNFINLLSQRSTRNAIRKSADEMIKYAICQWWREGKRSLEVSANWNRSRGAQVWENFLGFAQRLRRFSRRFARRYESWKWSEVDFKNLKKKFQELSAPRPLNSFSHLINAKRPNVEWNS